MKEYRLYKMTWKEIKDAINQIDAVLIPVGSTEQHGYHMPVDFDHFCATQLSELAAKAVNERGGWAVVVPTVPFGCSWCHMSFPGTITFSQKTFMKVVREVCESLAHHGFKNLIIVNGHAANPAPLTTCLTDLYAEKRIRVVLAQWWNMVPPVLKELGIESPMIHAEQIETSMAIALGVEVHMDKAVRYMVNRRKIHESKGVPTSRHIAYDAVTPGSGIIIPLDYVDDLTPFGVTGDPMPATREKGEKLVATVVSTLVELIEDLGKK